MEMARAEITKVLDSILDKKVLQRLCSKGIITKFSFEKKPKNFRRIFIEVVVYCGHRVQKALKRSLQDKEFNFIAGKVDRFLERAVKT
jgi:hypothetical protein